MFNRIEAMEAQTLPLEFRLKEIYDNSAKPWQFNP
jgi:hypothetical protein